MVKIIVYRYYVNVYIKNLNKTIYALNFLYYFFCIHYVMEKLQLDVAEFKKSHERLLEELQQNIEFKEHHVEQEPGFEEEVNFEQSDDSLDDITFMIEENNVQQPKDSNTSLENNVDSDESVITPDSLEYDSNNIPLDEQPNSEPLDEQTIAELFDQRNENEDNQDKGYEPDWDDSNKDIEDEENLVKHVQFDSTKDSESVSDVSDSSSEKPKPKYKCFGFGNIFNYKWCSKY